MEKGKEAETYDKKVENKEFLEVKATMFTTGAIVPISFQWECSEIKIDKVLNYKIGISLKDGIPGRRYECMVKNKRFFLWFTGKQWYLDI